MNNILVYNNESPLILNYKYNDKELTIEFFERYLFKLNDFDFSNYDSCDNKKIINSKFVTNNHWIYDVHFFVHSMILFVTQEKFSKIDNNLYLNLKKYFLFECKSNKMRCNCKHLEKHSLVYLEKFIFESNLFSKWIKKSRSK